LCIALSLATLSFYGCAAVRARDIVNPTYRLIDVTPHVNLGIPPSLDFDLTVGVDNPNSVDMRLDHFDFKLLVNDSRIANGTTADRVSIPARGTGDVRLRTHVSYDSLKSIFREVTDVVQGNRARYQILGNAAYDTPAGRMTFPVTVTR
jgi:hypothetical protein